jgi:NitT/TauT family transport system substrate-binding protein
MAVRRGQHRAGGLDSPSPVWRRQLRLTLLALAGAVLFLASACASNAKPSSSAGSSSQAAAVATAKPAHLTYGLVGPLNWGNLPEIVAQAKGFYAGQNLTIDFEVAGQSASVCQQILAGAVDIGACSINDMIQAVESGNAPLFQFLELDNSPTNYSVMAKPNIKSWSDMKGKTIIVGGPKDNTVYFFHAMARPNGLKDTDYSFEYAGASSARYAALKSGAVDAAILTDPYDYQAQQDGDTKIDVMAPKYVNSSNYGYAIDAATRDWAKGHSDELERFIRAEPQAVAWIYDPANKQEIFSLVGPKANVSQDELERLYQRDIIDSKFWSTDGKITDAGVQGVLNSLVDLGSLKAPTPSPSKYYDLQYLNAATAGRKP